MIHKQYICQTIDWVLQYLKCTMEDDLFKRGWRITMKAYVDDYTCLVNDWRYTSGYCIFLCGNLVASMSKMQRVEISTIWFKDTIWRSYEVVLW